MMTEEPNGRAEGGSSAGATLLLAVFAPAGTHGGLLAQDSMAITQDGDERTAQAVENLRIAGRLS